MSPIGRVFIVLNLALAGGFVFFAGTHLQHQQDYKSRLEAEQDARAKEKAGLDQVIATLQTERGQLEVAKTQRETELNGVKVALDDARDENKRLTEQNASLEGDIKQLVTAAEASNSQSKSAFDTATAAFEKAQADAAAKDAAIREKDSAVAENRNLKNRIDELNSTVQDKDLALADLAKERNELSLLVAVAEENGFVPGLAAPTLAGSVFHVANNRLCSIQITDNPNNVDIADQIAKRKFSFAIYDASSGYKGEAVATSYSSEENVVMCRLIPHKGEIQKGDKASTKTP